MFTIKTHASFTDESLYTDGLKAHCLIMSFSHYAVGKNRVRFFTKIQTGFLIRKRIFRFFIKTLNRIIDQIDPQRGGLFVSAEGILPSM